MYRIVLILGCAAMLSVGGCAHENPIQRQRDDYLLDKPYPDAYFPALSPAGQGPDLAQEPLAAAAPVFVDPQNNQNAPMDLQRALELALRNSEIVRVSEGSSVVASPDTAFDIGVAEARARAALAAFDASFSTRLYGTKINQPPNSFFGPGLAEPNQRDEGAFNAELTKPLITGGRAAIAFNPDPGYLYIPGGDGDSYNPTHVGQLDLSFQQPLLQGAGIEVNRAPIRISQTRSEQSAWEFKRTVMASVRSVTVAYWDLQAARVALKSIDEVIPLLEEVVHLQDEAYKAQWSIYADVAKAKAQLHDYRQQRLELQSEVLASEMQLRHLLGLPPADGWNVVPSTPPLTQLSTPDPSAAVQQAMMNQPDLARQRLNVRIREMELLLAENGRLPRLDFQALYRMNGVGEDLGNAISQLSTAEYSDWLLGATLAFPLGLRQGTAEVHAAELQLARERGLLQQTMLSVTFEVGNALRQIHYSYQAYQEAEQRAQAAEDWVKGSRMRYENPNPEAEGQNWLLQSLNDYLAAIRFRIDAATEAAAVLARYNADLVRLEEIQGTLLASSNIDLAYDPCQQLWRYGVSAAAPAEAVPAPAPDPQPATEPSGPSRLVPPAEPGRPPAAPQAPPLPADRATPVARGDSLPGPQLRRTPEIQTARQDPSSDRCFRLPAP